MSQSLPILEKARIASPCHVPWDSMTGDDRVRFCDQCEKKVYNLLDLPTNEAESIIQHHEGNLCVRLYQRRDGTLISSDCPAGLRAARRKLARGIIGLAAVFTFLISAAVLRGRTRDYWRNGSSLAWIQPFKWLSDFVSPPIPQIAGEICIPAPPVNPTPPNRQGAAQ